MSDPAVVKASGACALAGVLCGLAGSVVGAIHGLGGQEIAVHGSDELMRLAQKQAPYLVREWLFLGYVVFAVGEGVGLYFLTRGARGLALWAFVAYFVGAVTGIVQDATIVAFVHQFPTDYAAAADSSCSGIFGPGSSCSVFARALRKES